MTQVQTVHGGPTGRPSQQPGETMLWSMLTIAADQESMRQDVGDSIVRHIVVPLSAQARTWGGYRFGFSRNPEADQPAVHLHLRATNHVVERVWRFARELAEESAAQLGTLQFSASTDIVYPPRQGDPVPQLMEVTLARFGGPEGLKLAADIAELSADLSMWAVNRFPRLNTRSTLAALLLFDTGHAMMRGPRSAGWPDRRATSWDYYWNAHLQACTNSVSPRAEHARRAMMAQMAPRIMPAHRVMAALASEPSVALWRKRWSQAVDLYLYRAYKQRVSRPAQQLTMASSGLLMNRLGITPREEATLGFFARAWSRDLEAQYTGESSRPA